MVSFERMLLVAFCVAISACSPPGSKDAEAIDFQSRLIGHEYAVVPFSDTLAEGFSCNFAYRDDVWHANVEKTGWSSGLLLCGDRVPFLYLAKDIGVTQFAMSGESPPQPYARRKILAVQKLPPLANFSTGDEGLELVELVDSVAGQCDLDGRGGTSFVALVRWNGEAVLQGPPGVEAVWGFDVEAARVVSLDPQRVVCEPMLME